MKSPHRPAMRCLRCIICALCVTEDDDPDDFYTPSTTYVKETAFQDSHMYPLTDSDSEMDLAPRGTALRSCSECCGGFMRRTRIEEHCPPQLEIRECGAGSKSFQSDCIMQLDEAGLTSVLKSQGCIDEQTATKSKCIPLNDIGLQSNEGSSSKDVESSSESRDRGQETRSTLLGERTDVNKLDTNTMRTLKPNQTHFDVDKYSAYHPDSNHKNTEKKKTVHIPGSPRSWMHNKFCADSGMTQQFLTSRSHTSDVTRAVGITHSTFLAVPHKTSSKINLSEASHKSSRASPHITSSEVPKKTILTSPHTAPLEVPQQSLHAVHHKICPESHRNPLVINPHKTSPTALHKAAKNSSGTFQNTSQPVACKLNHSSTQSRNRSTKTSAKRRNKASSPLTAIGSSDELTNGSCRRGLRCVGWGCMKVDDCSMHEMDDVRTAQFVSPTSDDDVITPH